MRKTAIAICLTFFLVHLGFGQVKTEPLVIGEKFNLHSKYNTTDYEISVSLPQDYHTGNKRYPVLYLFYGRGAKFIAASGIVTSLSDATWQIPRMIVVGVTNIQWQRDLTPVPIEGRDNCGGAPEFLSFVAKDLLPTIDKNYRTTDHRLYMGHSFGGLFGAYAFIADDTYFDDFIFISPSISKRADYIQQAFREKIENSTDLTNKFYISIGSEGSRITRSALWLEEGLEAKNHDNLTWKFELFEGHNHHTHTQNSLINGLLFIFDKK